MAYKILAYAASLFFLHAMSLLPRNSRTSNRYPQSWGSKWRTSKYGRPNTYSGVNRGLTVAQRKEVIKIATKKIANTAELKYIDATLSAVAVNQGGSVNKVSSVPAGTTDSSRIGDELTIRDIEVTVRFAMTSTYSIANGSQAVRFILFQWYPDDTSAAPAAGNVLQLTGSVVAYLSAPHHDFRRQYKILYDTSAVLCATGPDSVIRSWVGQPGKKTLRYDGTGSSGDGQIYALWIGDAITNPPGMDMWCRINYMDL